MSNNRGGEAQEEAVGDIGDDDLNEIPHNDNAVTDDNLMQSPGSG